MLNPRYFFTGMTERKEDQKEYLILPTGGFAGGRNGGAHWRSMEDFAIAGGLLFKSLPIKLEAPLCGAKGLGATATDEGENGGTEANHRKGGGFRHRG